MRLMFSCSKCRFLEHPDDLEDIDTSIPTYLEIRDDGLYEFTCHQGHKNIVVLHQKKFEILYELGVMALHDGYTRESVANFAAALERLYEYAIRVLSEKTAIDTARYVRTWALVSRQSERQLGAFIFLYLSVTGMEPPVLSTKDVEFRNNVIHKGHLASHDEACRFGQVVLDHIVEIICALRQHCREAIQSVNIAMNNRPGTTGKDVPATLVSIPTTIHSVAGDESFGRTTLQEALLNIKKRVEYLYARGSEAEKHES